MQRSLKWRSLVVLLAVPESLELLVVIPQAVKAGGILCLLSRSATRTVVSARRTEHSVQYATKRIEHRPSCTPRGEESVLSGLRPDERRNEWPGEVHHEPLRESPLRLPARHVTCHPTQHVPQQIEVRFCGREHGIIIALFEERLLSLADDRRVEFTGRDTLGQLVARHHVITLPAGQSHRLTTCLALPQVPVAERPQRAFDRDLALVVCHEVGCLDRVLPIG